MPKKKGKHKQSRPPQKEPTAKRQVGIFASLLAACTIISALVVFVPRPVVSAPSAPADSNNVLSCSFEVSNAGYIPLYDVSFGVAPNFIRGPGPGAVLGTPTPTGVPDFEHYLTSPVWQHHNLGLDERITMDVGSVIKGSIDRADIAIVVVYAPWFMPVHRKKLFRFVTVKDAKGKSAWRSWPLGEPTPTQ